MISSKIYIEKSNNPQLLDTIRNFVKNRGFVLRENINHSMHVFTIYDKEVKSGVFVDMSNMFFFCHLIPQRIRLLIKTIEKEKYIEISLKGDIMMLEWDIIDDRPRKRDVIRCELSFNELVKQINNFTYMKNKNM